MKRNKQWRITGNFPVPVKTVKKILFMCVILIISSGGASALGKKDGPAKSESRNTPVYDSNYYNTAADGQAVVITGTIRLVGSDPFPRYILTEAGKYDWYIPAAEDIRIISGFEQKTVTVRGTVGLRDIILANGERAGIRRTLASISLVQ